MTYLGEYTWNAGTTQVVRRLEAQFGLKAKKNGGIFTYDGHGGSKESPDRCIDVWTGTPNAEWVAWLLPRMAELNIWYIVHDERIYSRKHPEDIFDAKGKPKGRVYEPSSNSASDRHTNHIHISCYTGAPAPTGSEPKPVPPTVPPVVLPAFVTPSRPQLVKPTLVAGKPYAIYKGKKFSPKMITYLFLLEQLSGLPVKVLQGSYNSSVPQSGGTHDGDGAADLSVATFTTAEKTRLLVAARLLGGAAWIRTPDQGNWGEHCHIIRVGSSKASSGAKKQMADYKAGKNGLSGGRKDDGPQVGVFDMDTSPWAKTVLTQLDVSSANLARKYRLHALEVEYIQNLLAVVGHPVVVDGDFGPASQVAFDSFRRSLGWPEADCIGEIGVTSSNRLRTAATVKFSTPLPPVTA